MRCIYGIRTEAFRWNKKTYYFVGLKINGLFTQLMCYLNENEASLPVNGTPLDLLISNPSIGNKLQKIGQKDIPYFPRLVSGNLTLYQIILGIVDF